MPAYITGICLPSSTGAEWDNEENEVLSWVVILYKEETDILTE